jgi:addiction module HigA family antidote
MHNPPHPGEALREDVLPALRMTASGLAQRLGCSLAEFSEVLDGRASITNDLARSLELAGLGAARVYLAEQAAYDLWQAKAGN